MATHAQAAILPFPMSLVAIHLFFYGPQLENSPENRWNREFLFNNTVSIFECFLLKERKKERKVYLRLNVPTASR